MYASLISKTLWKKTIVISVVKNVLTVIQVDRAVDTKAAAVKVSLANTGLGRELSVTYCRRQLFF